MIVVDDARDVFLMREVFISFLLRYVCTTCSPEKSIGARQADVTTSTM
jgi:hypothetical protein